jgi:biopolymer transport protein ExbD
MAMSPFTGDDDGLMNEINMTPLVDVTLVLLIVFIVTIPVIRHAVKIDLPHASGQKEDTKPAQVTVSIDADGNVLWDEQKISDDVLQAKIAAAAQQNPQPELHLNADRKVAYEKVAQVLSAAQAAGLTKIGFVTVPRTDDRYKMVHRAAARPNRVFAVRDSCCLSRRAHWSCAWIDTKRPREADERITDQGSGTRDQARHG